MTTPRDLSDTLEDLQKRIEKIEERVFGLNRNAIPSTESRESETLLTESRVTLSPLAQNSITSQSQASPGEPAPSDTSRLLGVIGIICFVLAAAFLVKLAIDSGWLTPARQIFGAALFGLLLIGIGLKLRNRDRSYFSQLPAAGIIILYLTVAAGNRRYDLYSPSLAVALMSFVSVISVFLYTQLRTQIFVTISTVGTYGSVFLLPAELDPVLFTTYFLIWDLSFAFLSVHLESRTMLLLASYLSLGVFQWTVELPWRSPTENIPFVIGVQAVQFGIFSVSLVYYAVRNQILAAAEAWSFFPILVFFYGIEYSLLNRVCPQCTPWLALGFGAFIYCLYAVASNRVKDQNLNSGEMIYAFLSIVLFHGLYLGILSSSAQIWIAPALVILLAFAGKHLGKQLWAFSALVVLIGAIGYLRCLVGDRSVSWNEIIVLNLIFGSLLLFGYGSFLGKMQGEPASYSERESWAVLALGFGHVQLLVGAYRILGSLSTALNLSKELRPFLTSSTWGALGIGILLWAKARRDATLARSALLILIVACAKLFLYDVSVAAPLIRVLCFLITGSVLYFGGYLLRWVNQWETKK